MKIRTYSVFQTAFFGDVATGTGHTVLRAVAGSGKTTTIVEALSHIPAGLTTLFVAFNKAIAEELKKRAPRGVEVSTLHSYGLRTITRNLGKLRIDNNRVYGLIDGMFSGGKLEIERAADQIAESVGVEREREEEISFEMKRDLAKTISLAKGALAADEAQIDAIIDDFEIESARKSPISEDGMPVEITPEMQDTFRQAFVKDVLTVLLRCTDTSDGAIDFDDMIWLPVVLDLRQAKFDRVFIDETQDLNPCQIELAMRAVKENGRIFAVGDPRQAIYRFRGADSAAVDNVVKRLQAKILPLSVCYRCCKAVIRTAQEVVPEIQWAPDAEEGVVADADPTEMKKGAMPGHFILSRTNAPLISLCLYFLKEGRPASIQGRDIGASLSSFVKKSAARSVEELCNYVEEWRDVESKRLAAKRRDTQAVEDRADCVLALSEGARSVNEVIGRIESLFADKDDSARIVLSTTHKAKGMERDTVWMLNSTYRRKPDVEEDNLYYVAVTRARKALFLVEGDLRKREAS